MTPTERKNELIKDLKDTLKIGIGAITVGGIVKEDWLQNNWFVWLSLVTFLVLLFLLNKKLQ